MATSTLYLPDYLPTSLNKLKGHWAASHRLKKGDQALVAHYAREQGLPLAGSKRRVSLRLIVPKGQRRLDPDNLLKSLADALVACGLLKNDSSKWVEWGETIYSRSETVRETFVLLEDLP